MDEDLLALISKLDLDSADDILNLDHPNIHNHLQVLKKRFWNKDYTERELIGVSILLQHYSLESFTDAELNTLLSFDLSSLEYHTDVEYEPVMSNRLKGVMDTGSLRVYSVMNKTGGINLDRLDYMMSKSYTASQFVQSYLMNNNICSVCSRY